MNFVTPDGGTGITLRAPRYVVTELGGWWSADANRSVRAKPGLSVQVVDRLACHRVVAQWRTEDYGGSLDARSSRIRYLAKRRCAELNGEPEPVRPRTKAFWPTCPYCGRRCHPDDAYCRCGKNLYRQEVGH